MLGIDKMCYNIINILRDSLSTLIYYELNMKGGDAMVRARKGK